MSGAKFRRGREDPKEFGETYLPAGSDSGTMGNTIMLQLRRTPGEDRPFRRSGFRSGASIPSTSLT